ncbi:hypothetical protein GQE38_02090 [Escherichia coli]|nr:hypothetical protein [Escherichia coli]
MIDYKKNLLFILVFISGFILFTVYSYTAEKMIYNETCTANWVIFNDQGRANLTIDFMWICPYISRHLLSLNPLQARCRRYSRGER